jgi:hypothetical protein
MIAVKRLLMAFIVGLLLAGTASIDGAHAQNQNGEKQSGGYAACKAKLSQVPPCSVNWTRKLCHTMRVKVLGFG